MLDSLIEPPAASSIVHVAQRQASAGLLECHHKAADCFVHFSLTLPGHHQGVGPWYEEQSLERGHIRRGNV